MSILVLSRHAEIRMRQRGMRPSDVDLILRFGSVIGGGSHDVYFLKNKNVRREIDRLNGEIRRQKRSRSPCARTDRERETRRLKREIHMLERLGSWKLVVAGRTVVTCYRSHRRDQRRMCRRGWESA